MIILIAHLCSRVKTLIIILGAYYCHVNDLTPQVQFEKAELLQLSLIYSMVFSWYNSLSMFD